MSYSYLSPDCRDRNHQKCNGVSWNMDQDMEDQCGCDCECYDRNASVVATDADLDMIEQEFAYTPWQNSCKDPTSDPDGRLLQCRRPAGHMGLHAVGWRTNGSQRLWKP